jgi:hypothetical protein
MSPDPEEIYIDEPSDEKIYQAAMEEWLGVLAQLWTAIGKPIDAERLELYGRLMDGVPLGLLERAVRRVLRENALPVVPPPGAVWRALHAELGNPRDIHAAIQAWIDGLWAKIIHF